MPIQLTRDYTTLTAQERASVEKRIPKDEDGQPTQTVEQFLDSLHATDDTLQEYRRQDEVADRAQWAPVVEVAFKLSAQSRLQVVGLIVERATAEGIDTSNIPTE